MWTRNVSAVHDRGLGIVPGKKETTFFFSKNSTVLLTVDALLDL